MAFPENEKRPTVKRALVETGAFMVGQGALVAGAIELLNWFVKKTDITPTEALFWGGAGAIYGLVIALETVSWPSPKSGS